jgi:hypothetical protein
MSKVCYFASDAQLHGKENPYIHLFSINEALANGVMLDMDFLEGIDKDEPGVIAWCADEDMFEFPNVWISEPYDQAPKTEKKHFAEMGGNPLLDLPGIVTYIQEHFALWEEVNELELWYVWLGSESTPFIETSCPLDKVTPEVLGEFFADPYLDFKLTITR